jgi:two-component system LytT family response regulator
MITALVIEDELYPRKVLSKLIAQHCPQVQVVGECADATEGLQTIREHQPDLIFLDIDMPGMSGLEMLNQLDEIDFDVIFTTAHDEYALEAFKVSPVDYLLKPVDENELVDAVQRLEKRRQRVFNKEQFELLMTNYHQSHIPLQKLAVPSHETLEFLDIDDIIRCEADRNYTLIFTRSGNKHVYSRTLKEIEKLLPEDVFFRVHQSHLVNLREVQTYVRGIGGQLILKNKAVIPVSRTRKEALMSRLFGK